MHSRYPSGAVAIRHRIKIFIRLQYSALDGLRLQWTLNKIAPACRQSSLTAHSVGHDEQVFGIHLLAD